MERAVQTPLEREATAWLPLLHDIADRADEIALHWYRAPGLLVDDKSDGSPVSEADRAIETMARALVAGRVPGLGVCGEEEDETKAAGAARLIIDPIDGTRNFVRGIPVFASLLGIEYDGRVVAGVVSAPAMRQRWHAALGAGAFNGTRRLHVSRTAEIAMSTVFHGDLGGRTEGRRPRGLIALLDRADRTRGFGDFYQHMLVAEGAGEIALDFKMMPWDVAAVKIVVEEAGGRTSDLSGADTIHGGSLVSTNGAVHDAVLAMLRAAD